MTDTPRSAALGFFGVLLLAADGLVWWLAGASQLPMPWLVVLLGLVAVAPLLWYGRKLPAAAAQERDLRPYVVAVVAQMAAIVVASVVLGLVGVWWVLPGVIAAIHGLGWLLLRDRSHTGLAIALAVIGLNGILLGVLSASVPRAMVIVGMPAAAALWCVPALAMVRQFRAAKAPAKSFHLSDLDADDSDDQ